MPEFEMPAGRYFSLSGEVTPTTGGQTRALLMRNRLLATRAGIEPVLLTFDSTPHYPHVRESLRRQGQLVDGMHLLNLYEYYREHPLDDLEPTGAELPDVQGFDAEETRHPDGTVYYTSYVHPRMRGEAIRDYRRPDGSVFLRVPAGASAEKGNPATRVILVDGAGRPVGSWTGQRGLRQRWIAGLAGSDERVFLISDSRFALAYVVPMPDERFHVLHLMHNIHLGGERRWNSALSPQYGPLMKSIPDLDALVSLTDRQRQDVAARYGATSNLFVVPNPVELPPRPDPLPERDAKRFVVVTRLEDQKRLEDAVRAFALVVKEEPDAVLEIYGDGKRRIPLEEEIAALGLQDSVLMRGHDPRARELLWTATGFLMSSKFEGYPLATLESMSHGCPVISYDIKYGPREQITDGVDGFLVEPGDLQAMADRVITLSRDPELVRRMSAAALEKAARHDYAAFLADWRTVLESVAARKPDRTTLESVKLTVTRLRYELPLPTIATRLRLPARFARGSSSSGAFRTPPVIDFAGKLTVKGHSRRATLDGATVTLDAVSATTGAVVPVPLQVRRSGSTFELAALIDPAGVFGQVAGSARGVKLRLRLVWNNSSWETTLRRSPRWSANYEVSFAENDELTLLRGPGAG